MGGPFAPKAVRGSELMMYVGNAPANTDSLHGSTLALVLFCGGAYAARVVRFGNTLKRLLQIRDFYSELLEVPEVSQGPYKRESLRRCVIGADADPGFPPDRPCYHSVARDSRAPVCCARSPSAAVLAQRKL